MDTDYGQEYDGASKEAKQSGLFAAEQKGESNSIQIPEISLPRGGGAIRGIDEKFEVNPANGTAGFTIPLSVTKGRNSFYPSLSLHYNSGLGNGPFGIGWSLGLASIQRKTDKGIPRYFDQLELHSEAERPDVFVLSGAEDLVPYLFKDDNGNWQVKEFEQDGFFVRRYRPRRENSFERLEEIRHKEFGHYWKVKSRENVTTFYGKSEAARIADPECKDKTFAWLPELSYDGSGNWIQYHYKRDSNLDKDAIPIAVESVPAHLHESNRRSGAAPYTNTYLKRISYGNKVAWYPDPSQPYDPHIDPEAEYFFEVVLDYGEHDNDLPSAQETKRWEYRSDAFSSFRSGFEIRVNRSCRRLLMFHHFRAEKQFLGTDEEEVFGEDYLVQSYDFAYKASSINHSGLAETTYLESITQCGYIRKPDGTYSGKSLPPLVFSYQELQWNQSIRKVDQASVMNAPVGLTNNYQWVDLFGEGISGILTEQAEAWYYKSNLGDIKGTGEVTFDSARQLRSKPSFGSLSATTMRIEDLAASGETQALVDTREMKGYFELTADEDWKAFKAFEQTSNTSLEDRNARFIDLTGNGQPDLVVTEEQAFRWYAANAKKGYAEAEYSWKAFDEEKGPAIVFADQEQCIFLADMCGDGLTDIVRIRNGAICYWANKGYGRFSAKVSMSNAPLFDSPDNYHPNNIHLADVSGTGATDIIYLAGDTFKAYINLSGNCWSDQHEIDPCFPSISGSQISVVDLLGSGTSCIVWSSELPIDQQSPMSYIDLMDSKKPHILIGYRNNLGKEISIQYESSTKFYLRDKLAAKPWRTKLPFPLQVVSKLVLEERITEVRFTSSYTYHHGHYDSQEREFRGFGRVEQIDTEHYQEWHSNNIGNQLEKDTRLYQKPVLTKTWFHTGALGKGEERLHRYREEYWYEVYNKSFPDNPISMVEAELPDVHLNDPVLSLYGEHFVQALKACRGSKLRQEIFALDASDQPDEAEVQLQLKPYTVMLHSCEVQLLQPGLHGGYPVFLIAEREAMTIHYERDETDFRLRHKLNTKFDELGNVLEEVSVVYGRNPEKASETRASLASRVTDFSDFDDAQKLHDAFTSNIDALQAAQQKMHILVSRHRYAKFMHDGELHSDLDLPTIYRTRLPFETATYEITGVTPAENQFRVQELADILDSDSSEIAYQASPSGQAERRLIERQILRYRSNDFINPLPFGQAESEALPDENFQLAYTEDLIEHIYQHDGGLLEVEGTAITELFDSIGSYTKIQGNYWVRSGRTHFLEEGESAADAKARFQSPICFENPFGLMTKLRYDVESFGEAGVRKNDGYYLFIREIEDPIGNRTSVDRFNYRVLSATRVLDINANPTSILMDELGMVKALALEGNGFFDEQQHMLEAADELSAIKAWTSEEERALVKEYFSIDNSDDLKAVAASLIGGASVRFVYDLDIYQESARLQAEVSQPAGEVNHCDQKLSQPTVVGTIIREQHFSEHPNSNLQLSFEYSEGLGNLVMTKSQAAPGPALKIQIEADCSFALDEIDSGEQLRWIGTGRTILNNKGNAVKRYEPYFSVTPFFEAARALVQRGVSPILHYDSLGRLIRTDMPDGTFTKVVFDAWGQQLFDQNDTVLDSHWHLIRTESSHPDFIEEAKQFRAAKKAELHASTPSSLFFDSLGRSVMSIEHNGTASGKEHLFSTFIDFDVEGNALGIRDARGNSPVQYQYNLLSQRIAEDSMDDGKRWSMRDVGSKPLHTWDQRGQVWTYQYDRFNRPLYMRVQGGDGPLELDHIFERYMYGDHQANAEERNLKGQVYIMYDSAGKVETKAFDFKGNPLQVSRGIAGSYQQSVNWFVPEGADESTAISLLDESLDSELPIYSTEASYDALGRLVLSREVDGSLHRPTYNPTGLLHSLKVALPNPAGGIMPERTFIGRIDYDEKGRRMLLQSVDAQEGILTSSRYDYDPETHRLLRLRTLQNGNVVQDLQYCYDPVGNLSEIEDAAIPSRFFNNFMVEARTMYHYDPLYRLIVAEGREHAGQAMSFGSCDNWNDNIFRINHQVGDDMAWQNYRQAYRYDPVGNVLQMRHTVSGNSSANWTRNYLYAEASNRLLSTQIGNNLSYAYSHHDHHGLITGLPHLSEMAWNFKGELQHSATQQSCTGVPEQSTWYMYDSAGQRIRKVTDSSTLSQKRQQRIYLGQVEIYRSYDQMGILEVERQTLHIGDGSGRIAQVDTLIQGNDDFEQQLIRYQLSNHLGSAQIELDEHGNVISYEEFHPYGTSAYRAQNADIRSTSKRYRYTAMERDEESGLSYHAARYYLPWLGRWLSADPIGVGDGVNVWRYAGGKPTVSVDRTGNRELNVHADPDKAYEAARQSYERDLYRYNRERKEYHAQKQGYSEESRSAFEENFRFIAGDLRSRYKGLLQQRSALPEARAEYRRQQIIQARKQEELDQIKSNFHTIGTLTEAGGAVVAAIVLLPIAIEGAATAYTAAYTAAPNATPFLTELALDVVGGEATIGVSTTVAGTAVAVKQADNVLAQADDLGALVDDIFDSGRLTAGELLTLQPHRAASKARNVFSVSGRTHQSAHFGPQSAYRDLANYNAKDVLTIILPRATHARFDNYWKQVFRQLAAQSSTGKITGRQLLETVSDAVRNSPDFTAAEKISMIARLEDEFVELGLSFDSLVRLPYSK